MEYTVANGSYFGSSETMCTPLHIIYPLPTPVASDNFDGSNYTPLPPISSPPLRNDANYQRQYQPFSLMQMNGRKVLGPPEDWQGSPPSSACELFVRRIPRNIDEQRLIQPFLRFGQIYEMRLPMDFNQANRGYAYVRYTTEEEANCAMEVLNHFYVAPHRKLEILQSYEKCCLFVSNIPKYLDEIEIEEKLRTVFPTMERIYIQVGNSGKKIIGDHGKNDEVCNQEMRGTNNDCKNRGYAVIHFPSHLEALEAKKSTTPGVIRMWNRDLKVVWANTERDTDTSKSNKTLFVRNVDLCINKRDIMDMLVKFIPRQEIRKVTKVRTIAFCDFTTREAAEKCLQELQGTILQGQCLSIEWAKPSEKQSLHRMCRTDFDAMLRLKCIANCWQIPVIIFGTYFEREDLQYGAVMMRSAVGTARSIFCVLQCQELVDIHSRICEVVCVLLETIGTFPDYNYFFFVESDNAHLLGIVTNDCHSVSFIASHQVPQNMHFDLNEIIDMSLAISNLAAVEEDVLLQAYHESFHLPTTATYLPNLVISGYRIFGTIFPKYRNKPPLAHNLNDTQIVLALCYLMTGTNTVLPSRPYIAYPVSSFDNGYERLRFVSLKLLPIAVTQSRYLVHQALNHVQFGNVHNFHPAQRFKTRPLWITGCSYAKSLKQPTPAQIMHVNEQGAQDQQYNNISGSAYMPSTYASSSVLAPISKESTRTTFGVN
ncbi:uncharacterized protein LOC126760664 [Bactrocera neohumeralis]|uniref:uncharacterized protein LOC126760664 n=1 Tax=Bactrocera neohumeralis TaxID=98809 RepID=UPI002165F837|nr:uncharacterized protein LOC126760664 [Bactrocera neohumeralis]